MATKGWWRDAVLDYNWDTRVYSLSGQTLMVSALRRMIEESHTLTVEATVNQKRWLFGQFVDCSGLTLLTALGLPSLSYLWWEQSSAELNGCNFEVKERRTLSALMERMLWTCCHCPWKYSKCTHIKPYSGLLCIPLRFWPQLFSIVELSLRHLVWCMLSPFCLVETASSNVFLGISRLILEFANQIQLDSSQISTDASPPRRSSLSNQISEYPLQGDTQQQLQIQTDRSAEENARCYLKECNVKNNSLWTDTKKKNDCRDLWGEASVQTKLEQNKAIYQDISHNMEGRVSNIATSLPRQPLQMALR